ETDASTPITEIVVNSLITAPSPGEQLAADEPTEIRGIAWDGGYGVASVEVSIDGGTSWWPAGLGEDLGRFSFRPWSMPFTPRGGPYTTRARATNRQGQIQVKELLFNPAGYHNNVPQRIDVTAA